MINLLKRTFSALALLIVSITICLAISELIVRKLRLVPTTSIQAKNLTADKLSYIPNSKWQYVEPEFSEDVHINSIGYRDQEVSFDKPSILFLGDSQTYGTGVQFGERVSELVNSYLRSKCPAPNNHQVVNISMPGASTRKELAMLREILAKGLKVDHLFLMIVSNDYHQNYQEELLENVDNDSKHTFTLKEKSIKLARTIRYESHLLLASLKALSEVPWFRRIYAESKILGGLGEILNTDILYYNNPKIQNQILITENYIQQIANIAPTTLVLVPDRYRYDLSLQKIIARSFAKRNIDKNLIDFDLESKMLKQLSENQKLELIDPISSFRSANNTASMYYPINGHLTKNGHSLLASDIIKKSNYLNNLCSTSIHDLENQTLPDDFIRVSGNGALKVYN